MPTLVWFFSFFGWKKKKVIYLGNSCFLLPPSLILFMLLSNIPFFFNFQICLRLSPCLLVFLCYFQIYLRLSRAFGGVGQSSGSHPRNPSSNLIFGKILNLCLYWSPDSPFVVFTRGWWIPSSSRYWWVPECESVPQWCKI